MKRGNVQSLAIYAGTIVLLAFWAGIMAWSVTDYTHLLEESSLVNLVLLNGSFAEDMQKLPPWAKAHVNKMADETQFSGDTRLQDFLEIDFQESITKNNYQLPGHSQKWEPLFLPVQEGETSRRLVLNFDIGPRKQNVFFLMRWLHEKVKRALKEKNLREFERLMHLRQRLYACMAKGVSGLGHRESLKKIVSSISNVTVTIQRAMKNISFTGTEKALIARAVKADILNEHCFAGLAIDEIKGLKALCSRAKSAHWFGWIFVGQISEDPLKSLEKLQKKYEEIDGSSEAFLSKELFEIIVPLAGKDHFPLMNSLTVDWSVLLKEYLSMKKQVAALKQNLLTGKER